METIDYIKCFYFDNDKDRKEYDKTGDPKKAVGYTVVLDGALIERWGKITDFSYIKSRTKVVEDPTS